MKVLLFLLLVCFFTSCVTTKPYTWDGKTVTEKKYNKLLNNYTRAFVKKTPYGIGDFRLVYDTINGKD